ncbi:MAG: sugar ABC transporter permease [Fimbriimonadales bacterium]|mgnify:FL=1|jgi:multiple sugar transport system permease protein|nr:sugar ABC transporter permease [Fimbriimonadales bacterium]GBC89586.1 Lactose transport system permease protein LacF [bacterium HR14]GIV12658.1 MAG: ABC transporter permease [Fimbriimonadales bacterium]CUU04199.1 multiple sugar transport system permease protein [Armatimonadetes bacterium GBS]CUU33711.1 multiple sugar transport system permease protein [Armatimonadetes bacterium GXS]
MRLETRRTLYGYLFVLPWLTGFMLFTLYPILATLYFSFTDYRVLGAPRWVGLENYRALLADADYFWRSVGNTLFMLIEVPLSVVLGIGLALLLNQRLRGQALYRTLFYLPSVVPAVATAFLWLWVLNPQNGLAVPMNQALTQLGFSPILWFTDPATAKWGFIVMDLWAIGGVMVIYLAALQGVPSHLYEAALLDGARGWQLVRHITLPQIAPVIQYMVIIGVIGAFQYFTQTFIATQGGPENSTLFYALYLFQNAFQFFRFGHACAMAWLLFLITLVATYLIWKISLSRVFEEAVGD